MVVDAAWAAVFVPEVYVNNKVDSPAVLFGIFSTSVLSFWEATVTTSPVALNLIADTEAKPLPVSVMVEPAVKSKSLCAVMVGGGGKVVNL